MNQASDSERILSVRNAIIVAAILVLSYAAISILLRDHEDIRADVLNVHTVISDLFATLCLFYGAFNSKHHSRIYLAWTLIALSRLSFSLGDIAWGIIETGLHQSPFPSVADIGFLGFYPLFALGILMLPKEPLTSSQKLKVFLDTGILVIASTLIFWIKLIAPTIASNANEDPLTLTLAVAYPVADLLLLFGPIELLFRRIRSFDASPILFLAASMSFLIATDFIFLDQSLRGTYVSGGLVDAGWIASYALMGLAGVSQANSGKFDLPSGGAISSKTAYFTWPIYIPSLCIGIVYLILIWGYYHPLPIGFSALSWALGAIICLFALRQILVLKENTSLYAAAQEEIAERADMQAQVVQLNRDLESRIADRTAQIENANKDLQRQILDRRMAEEALRNSERRLAEIIDFLPDATFVINRPGEVIAWNRAIEKMTGVKAIEMLGGKDYQHALPFYGEKRPLLADIILNPILGLEKNYESLKWQEDGTLSGEVFIPNFMGSPKYLHASAAILYDSEGEIYGAIESIRDITENKMAEEDLKIAKDRAESATEAKSRFLANMSHEIRTPMNAVIGMSDLLLQMDPTEEQLEYLKVIKNSGNALLALINDILDYSKIESSKEALEMQPFLLSSCIESSMDMVAAGAAEKSLDLVYVLEDDTPARIIGDEGRLRQILINLLGNAVKFTERGEVVLKVSHFPCPDSKVQLHFDLTDTGIGISEHDLSRIFQSFSQGSSNRYFGGTGLGLAISRRLVEMMHGKISVRSAPGKGSSFSFSIICDTPLASTDIPPPNKDLMEKRVLIVEPNQWVQEMLHKALNSWKMVVSVCSNGGQAEEKLAECSFDFIIIDAVLADMKGEQLAQKIAAMPERPLIIMISHIGRRLKPDPSVDGALSKPVKPDQLKLLLIKLIQRTGEADADLSRKSASIIAAPTMRELFILLAEDNPVNQRVVIAMLKKLGYQADRAANGREVLAALEAKSYDLILMDVQMPDMDGLEATRRIREKILEKQPCIIAVTAYALQGDKERFLKAGMNDYLSKPVRMDELKKALERCQAST